MESLLFKYYIETVCPLELVGKCVNLGNLMRNCRDGLYFLHAGSVSRRLRPPSIAAWVLTSYPVGLSVGNLIVYTVQDGVRCVVSTSKKTHRCDLDLRGIVLVLVLDASPRVSVIRPDMYLLTTDSIQLRVQRIGHAILAARLVLNVRSCAERNCEGSLPAVDEGRMPQRLERETIRFVSLTDSMAE